MGDGVAAANAARSKLANKAGGAICFESAFDRYIEGCWRGKDG